MIYNAKIYSNSLSPQDGVSKNFFHDLKSKGLEYTWGHLGGDLIQFKCSKKNYPNIISPWHGGSGWGPRYTALICVGPHNLSGIVVAQKQIWSGNMAANL